jgi:hypothetical protein
LAQAHIDQTPRRAVNELEVADLHGRGVGAVENEVDKKAPDMIP